uniref:Uncharacterized protein n=1 Tax=Ailuropoda melanoleuca TaxID=9646 RepID=A0A7N5KB41_AILME
MFAGIPLTGSPQDPYMLACWPHSSNCLPALMHPSDSTCCCVNPKSFLCLTHFPAVGALVVDFVANSSKCVN